MDTLLATRVKEPVGERLCQLAVPLGFTEPNGKCAPHPIKGSVCS